MDEQSTGWETINSVKSMRKARVVKSL